ncbi:MAG: type II toxin-antitoxin system RelE/ParE family toxin [Clostridiales Family XIII bacterium]|nr:type II toxin-antitoxin system RelE/ParE family toxin [Clostridiales Family XIII bacterium]
MSKPAKISFSELFFSDLDDIFEYISQNFSQDLAYDIIRNLQQEIIERLKVQPTCGRVYPDDDFYRYIFVSKRKDIVFYHIGGSGAVIVYRIFDQRRDFASILSGA